MSGHGAARLVPDLVMQHSTVSAPGYMGNERGGAPRERESGITQVQAWEGQRGRGSTGREAARGRVCVRLVAEWDKARSSGGRASLLGSCTAP